MDDGGYQNFRFWHAEGWDWSNSQKINSPMYWHKIDGKWHSYELSGLREIDENLPGCGGHVHQSLWDAKLKKNLFYNEKDKMMMSEVMNLQASPDRNENPLQEGILFTKDATIAGIAVKSGTRGTKK